MPLLLTLRAGPRRITTTIRGAVQVEYALSGMGVGGLSDWGEFNYINQDSTGLRYAYDRHQIIAGVRW